MLHVPERLPQLVQTSGVAPRLAGAPRGFPACCAPRPRGPHRELSAPRPRCDRPAHDNCPRPGPSLPARPSATAMAVAHSFRKGLFGPIGISLIGALIHVATQFFIVLFLYVKSSAVLFLLPLLLLSGFVGGLVVGWVALRLLPLLKSIRLHA